MSAGTRWTTPRQAAGDRIRAVAAYGGVEITLGEGYEHMVTNRTPEFQAKFASGKIPAFEAASGLKLFVTEAIARYIAALGKNSSLLGSGIEEEALIDQWVSYGDHELQSYLYLVGSVIRGAVPYNKSTEQHFRERIDRSLGVLEKHLKDKTFLVNERITLADISVAAVLKNYWRGIGDAQAREKVPNLLRFYNTIANHPKIKPVWGETEFIEKAIQYTPPAKTKPAKEKDAAPAAPKEKAPAPKKAADDDDDDEPLVPEEPKAKNPLDLLPKSDFNLEDWKRAYSNMDTRGAGGSLEWFYGKFDKEGFSIWRVDFKYPEELTLVFMSSNQITGFFNRLEASRKYLFGSVGVLGQNNNSLISGVFICRGKDFKPVVDVAPDWESYQYKEVNLEDKADKDFFEAALAWDLEIDGKKWADGKAFK
jgi:elongation factor 1-gamma